MRSIKRVAAVASLALGLAALSACGGGGSDEGGSGEVVGSVERGPETDVTQSGDTLKVVALGWSDGEIALSLGVKPTAVYDWQGHGEDNNGVGPWASEKFGDTDVTVIKNAGSSYNYEQVELLEPDVILNVRAAGDEKVFDRLSKIAPVATAPEGTGDFAVDWRTQTEVIAKAIGAEDEAEKAIADTTKVIEDAAAANPDFKDKQFAYGVKFGDAYGAYTKGDARFDTFAELGFASTPAVDKLAPNGFYAAVAAEQVKALDSQVDVLSTIGLPLSDLEGDKLISSLDVVKDGRAVILDEKDEINVALAAGTPQSIAIAVEGIVPQLAEAVAKVS